MLISIQYARALAAMLVVWAHIAGFAVSSPLGLPEFGGFGVDLFFVISGYIMWTTAAEQAPRLFAVRRIARIVPAYWFYTTVLVAIWLVAPQLTPRVNLDAWEVVCSYLFIPHANQRGEINPVLLQGWTLNTEMFFYGVFCIALSLPSRAARFAGVVSILVAGVLLGIANPLPASAVVRAYTSSIVLEFVMGMTLAVISSWRPIPEKIALMLVLAGTAGLWAASDAVVTGEARFAVFGVPSMVLLFGLIGLEGWFRRRPISLLVRIGDASYSLYLSHPFILSATAILVALGTRLGLHPQTVALMFAGIGMCACIIFAMMSFRFIETPLGRITANFLQRRAN